MSYRVVKNKYDDMRTSYISIATRSPILGIRIYDNVYIELIESLLDKDTLQIILSMSKNKK